VRRYLALVLVLLGPSAIAQECPMPHRVTPVLIHVTHQEYPIASLKSRLIHLLTDSLIDEGRGLVDVTREHQIQYLMKQLKEESIYAPHDQHRNEGTDEARRDRADSTPKPTERKRPILK